MRRNLRRSCREWGRTRHRCCCCWGYGRNRWEGRKSRWCIGCEGIRRSRRKQVGIGIVEVQSLEILDGHRQWLTLRPRIASSAGSEGVLVRTHHSHRRTVPLMHLLLDRVTSHSHGDPHPTQRSYPDQSSRRILHAWNVVSSRGRRRGLGR